MTGAARDGLPRTAAKIAGTHRSTSAANRSCPHPAFCGRTRLARKSAWTTATFSSSQPCTSGA